VKRRIIIFGIFLLLLFTAQDLWADRNGFVRKVVIDPGHGGRDPGAVGAISKEKDIVLSISLKLGQYIKENFDDVEVIYTRSTDVFVPLHERARIANENKADLFISVHCNASRSNRAFGTETFVMGSHRNQENLEVAKKENASILFEDDYKETYDGYDPNSPEANIIFSMFQFAHLNQSLTMASLVQNQFRERANRNDRGVKQAGFLVLYRVTMPAILVEAGFLSNAQEEKYLASEQGQTLIASAIFRAFRDYKTYQDKLATQKFQDLQVQQNPQSSQSITPTMVHTVTHTETSSPQISFRVQFATTSREIPVTAAEFQGLEGVSFYFHDGLYKYTLGNESSMEDALKIQKQLQEKGYKDSFVVAFKNNERITAQQAMQFINQNIQIP
jgi:N-acetylmuramoyl-L-alanine amidase